MIFDLSCEEIIGFRFRDKNMLRRCFTHSSYGHEHNDTPDNERLEFFGDSILGYCAAEYLYKNYPTLDEGGLTELKQKCVSRAPLSEAVKRMGLDKYILYGEGEKRSSDHVAACEDLFEALVAGIYLDEDGGLDAAKKFIYDKLLIKAEIPKAENKPSDKKIKDFKSLLQEYVQKNKLGAITYPVKDRRGPDHSPTFISAVAIDGKEIASGEGKCKKDAEKIAAEKAYKILCRTRKNGNKSKKVNRKEN